MQSDGWMTFLKSRKQLLSLFARVIRSENSIAKCKSISHFENEFLGRKLTVMPRYPAVAEYPRKCDPDAPNDAEHSTLQTMRYRWCVFVGSARNLSSAVFSFEAAC